MFSIGVLAQNSNVKLNNDEIIIPLNSEFKINVEINKDKLDNFKIINQSEVSEPIDMMKALENVEKKDTIANEINFKFCYADFMGSKLVVLTTVHHLENSIIFKAKIKIKGRTDYIETSIVDKHPNVYSIEQWQDEIETIILYDFQIIDK